MEGLGGGGTHTLLGSMLINSCMIINIVCRNDVLLVHVMQVQFDINNDSYCSIVYTSLPKER